MPFFTFNYQQVLDEVISLDDLSNVGVSAPTEGSVLAFDSGSSEWQARDIFNNVEDTTTRYVHTYSRNLPSNSALVESNTMYLSTFVAKYDMLASTITCARVTGDLFQAGRALMQKNVSNQPVALDGSVYQDGIRYLPGGVVAPNQADTSVPLYKHSLNCGLISTGKRWLVLYKVNFDSNGVITTLDLVGSTNHDQTIFDFDNQVSSKLFSSPVQIVAGEVYAAGYLISGTLTIPNGTSTALSGPQQTKIFSQNYSATVNEVASSTGIADYGLAPSFVHYAGATATTVLSAPPSVLDGPANPKVSVSKSHTGTVASVVLNNVANLYTGMTVQLFSLGAGYDGFATLASVNAGTNTITFNKSRTGGAQSSTADTDGHVFSSANLNWRRTAGKAASNVYRRPWIRLEV